ncbi:glucosamine-6-phosphate deaminase [Pseudalkalibacillus salsuginis]|uniref:glucosamine-6-phosphate deaminase n=1 Tax=Pseudalkalibacillus salsuginis TaxID=2910972 RepID=UPI001F1D9D8A|nr:glucosamine-6-phosphate deaminase [Pseudalkalibacillus salsuginis]MCF6408343.1 glucosamine-6-phosphate deaminase [Pseudalkalibacillus salsuginis]
MNVIAVDDKQEMSEKASAILFNEIKQNPELVLGVATGGTPTDTYDKLVEKVLAASLDLSKITTVNLDEYVGLAREHEESYWYYIYTHLYEPLGLSPDRALVPYGLSDDLQEECIRYEKSIEKVGGIDLQLLGVGRNGHIGFNEPGTPFESKTHLVELTDSTRQANARFFEHKEEVPTRAITVGISTIMKSRSILLLASGEEKAEPVNALLRGDVGEKWPVTVLNQHPSVTLVVTKDALEIEEDLDHDQ